VDPLAPDEVAATIQLADPARAREGVAVKLVFGVRSIDDLRVPLSKLGGQIDPDAAPWAFQGLTHSDVVDPEGNIIQLQEPLAGQAETRATIAFEDRASGRSGPR
jgi:hypothetical protein